MNRWHSSGGICPDDTGRGDAHYWMSGMNETVADYANNFVLPKFGLDLSHVTAIFSVSWKPSKMMRQTICYLSKICAIRSLTHLLTCQSSDPQMCQYVWYWRRAAFNKFSTGRSAWPTLPGRVYWEIVTWLRRYSFLRSVLLEDARCRMFSAGQALVPCPFVTLSRVLLEEACSRDSAFRYQAAVSTSDRRKNSKRRCIFGNITCKIK